MHQRALKLDAIVRLAKLLQVSESALTRLGVGYGELAGSTCWSVPERNAAGLCVGINRRLLDGRKRTAPGGRRGLTYTQDWHRDPGVIYLVEGASDVAAGLTLGLCVVGRPSNTGGVRDLVPLLAGTDRSRRIVVLGERDRKQHASLPAIVASKHDPKCRGCQVCYPGHDGAMRVAGTLRKRLARRVEWWLPPRPAKDLRQWLIDHSGQGLAAARAAWLKLTGETIPGGQPNG